VRKSNPAFSCEVNLLDEIMPNIEC
jgi:hypothetical protein